MRYVITIICCYTQCLLAQPGFRTLNIYTTQNGLSNNTITCIRQDSRGFLWIGTKEGLNRFDGYRFQKIFSDKDHAIGLAGNTITSLLEYKKGWLLIATSNGLSVFNTLSSRFENEKINSPELRAGSGTLIYNIYKDKKGNIWVNHSGELDLLDSNLNFAYRFTDLPWTRTLKGIIINRDNFFTDKQDRLWVAADTSGIQIIDFAQQKIWNNRNNPQQLKFLNTNFIRSAFLDETSNILWYAPWGQGIFKYNLTTHEQEQQSFGSSIFGESISVNSITQVAGGKLLCGLGGKGCFIVDQNTLHYEQVPGNIGYVYSLFRSADDHYWTGTQDGLFQLENEGAGSLTLDFKLNDKVIPWTECSGMLRLANGNLYIANRSNTLIEVEKNFRDHKTYTIPDKNEGIIPLEQDDQGRIWAGTSKGLYLFDENKKKFTQPHWLHPDLVNCQINYIFCDRENDCWIATRYPFGLYRYSKNTGICEKIKNDITDHFLSLGSNSRISFITEDNKQQVWMGSRLGGGIIYFNKKSGEWKIYLKQGKDKNTLSRGLGYLYADDKNNLWMIDQFGTGLIRYNYLNDSISFITRHDGLPSDFITSISPDDMANFWILTDYGISKFDLQKNKINFNSLFKSKPDSPIEFMIYDALSKSLVCASMNRLQLYPVAMLRPASNEVLLPFIDKVWVNNKELTKDVNGQQFQLNPDEKNITIDFTAVHYSNADKIKFAYQLAGADNDWKYTDANRSAQYTVLTPGKYVFKIKVADENGNWGKAYEAFSFTIVPYFWQTAWFKIAISLLVVASCWLIVRRRITHIRHEAELKQKIAETEMMALRAQMNPHFIFNCINSIDAMIQSNDKYHATLYLNKFAKLIRNILDSSKQNLVLLSKDLETLQLYVDLEMFRHENKFRAEINVEPQLLQDDYQVPPLIIQPYVENAILHGLRYREDNNGKLTVSVQRQNGNLKYEITDNGVGRDKGQESSSGLKKVNGYGMQMSEDRVRIFNREEKASVQVTDLENENGSTGTKVTVQLKIN